MATGSVGVLALVACALLVLQGSPAHSDSLLENIARWINHRNTTWKVGYSLYLIHRFQFASIRWKISVGMIQNNYESQSCINYWVKPMALLALIPGH